MAVAAPLDATLSDTAFDELDEREVVDCAVACEVVGSAVVCAAVVGKFEQLHCFGTSPQSCAAQNQEEEKKKKKCRTKKDTVRSLHEMDENDESKRP